MNTLIVGGSSGLGLALAKEFADQGDKVIVTGRTKPAVDFVSFKKLDLSAAPAASIKQLVDDLPKIERLVYAAGFYQDGRVTDLSDQQIEEMINVAGTGLIYFMREVLLKQGQLAELITVTSTSQ